MERKQVENQVEEARKALKNGRLFEYAKRVATASSHPLHRYLNKYPCLPFVIGQEDRADIDKLMAFPHPVPKDHEWTALEKILYAARWKDGKLESIKKIIEGVEAALDNSVEPRSSAVVYHYFGKHLTDPVGHPILDQHTIRAQKLIIGDKSSGLTETRVFDSPSEKDAQDYIKWFKGICANEKIDSAENIKILDSYLFALGKYSKENKPKRK